MTTRPPIFRSAAVVSACTGLSRLLGLVREGFMAYFFGTSLAKSAFDVAFTIPNLFRRLFGEGALSAAFIPVFVETLEKDGIDEANRLGGRIMSMLGVALLAIILGGVILISICLTTTLGIKVATVLPLLRIMLPYMFFICMVAFCMAVLNSFHHFVIPAITPVILNVVWIVVLIFICPRLGDAPIQRIYGVAWGILAAGAIQFLIQIPFLIKHKFNPQLSFQWHDKKVSKVMALWAPAALGMGVHQINLLVDKLLAFGISTWATAALGYAERLIYLPLGLFATALGTVLLPTFSSQEASGDRNVMLKTMNTSLRVLMLVMIPAAVGLLVMGYSISRLFFMWQGGIFDESSCIRTARAVWFYAPGLILFSVYKVFVPMFYAMKDTRTPFMVGVGAVVLNIVLNIAFIVTWPYEFKHAGLAAATVIASGLNGLVLGCIIHRRVGDPGWLKMLGSLLRMVVCAGIMGLIVYYIDSYFDQTMPQTKVSQALCVLVCVVSGGAVYAGLASILCKADVRDLVTGFVKRKQ